VNFGRAIGIRGERAGSGGILHAQEFVNSDGAIGIIPAVRARRTVHAGASIGSSTCHLDDECPRVGANGERCRQRRYPARTLATNPPV
jgi:hypothetical protein